MPRKKRLPTAEDGVDGLVGLADEYGTEEAFTFLGYILTVKDSAPARAALALRLVEEHMQKSGEDFDTARRSVADALGYTHKTRTNFYKMVDQMSRRTFKPFASRATR